MRVPFVSLACLSLVLFPAYVTPGAAQSVAASTETTIASPIELADPSLAPQTTAPPPVAFEYSDGYRLRAKIHKISSFATLPLFGAEAIVGQSLYSDRTQGKKDAHLAIAAGIGALFVVDTATGVWNLIEARKDPVHRGRRLAHGLMMLAADAGFLATAALGPESEHGTVEGSRATHRAVAFTSIGVASASYLIMLFGSH
jgi:hypothetical protein